MPGDNLREYVYKQVGFGQNNFSGYFSSLLCMGVALPIVLWSCFTGASQHAIEGLDEP